MGVFNIDNYFLTLSALATFLLWGISIANGTVKALILASWHGVLEDGTRFATNYTGIFPIDFPLSLLVAFFYHGTNGGVPAYQHFLIDAYSTLQSGFVWLYIESGREAVKPRTVANPIIWGIIWQCFGAAISLPLYYRYHLRWLRSQSSNIPSTPLPFAKAIPLSFILGAVLPAVVGMLPTWVDRSSREHQMILAFWQPDPIWVSLVQSGAVATICILQSTNKTRDSIYTSSWIKLSYALAALASATGHIYVRVSMVTSSDPDINFVRMYIPKTFSGMRDDLKLVDGPWLFLQYDLIIIALSSLSWAYTLVSDLSPVQSKFNATRIIWFVLGFLVLGAGGTVSLALYWRESELQRRRQSATPKEVKKPLAKIIGQL